MTRMAALILIGAILGDLAYSQPAERETVLDRKVHIYKDLVRDIPDVPPLCDSLKVSKDKIDIGGCRLYCEQEGQGTPLVLLNGGPGATHHDFHPHFSKAAAFARVVYYDQRGCGWSDYNPGDGYSVQQAVEDLDKLREALKIDKWVVLGHSYGGALAQCYALKHPDRVKGLVLVGSAYYGLMPGGGSREGDYVTPEERKRIREIYSDRSLSEAQQLFNVHRNGDWKRQNFYRPTDDDLARMARYEWKHDRAFRGAMGQSIDQLSFEHAFETCPLPTLVMEGHWDLTWDEGKPERLRACFNGAQLKVFERAGHSPFADEPDAFFAALQEFIQGLPDVPQDQLTAWQEKVATLEREAAASPKQLVKQAGWGRKSNEAITKAYTAEWLQKLDDTGLLLKTGFALYDAKRYDDALAVFRVMEKKAQGNPFDTAVARVWQGHMLDLLGKHEEAVPLYESVVSMNVAGRIQHDQFGLAYTPSDWAAQRIKTPFTRVENNDSE